MLKIIPLLIASLLCTQAFAQKNEKVTYLQVKQQCANMSREKMARVSVTRFNVTTTSVNDGNIAQNASTNNTLKALSILSGGGGNAPRADEIPLTLADNLTTMLTNALQGVSCFRVLESMKNNADLTVEIDGGNSAYSGKKTPKAGKQLGAQIVVTGEVIEYSIKDKGINVMGVGAKKKLVKIGFNLKMINPETRDVISSKVIRVQSKSSNSVSVLGLVSTDNNDPAVAAVMEDGILQAIVHLTHVRDSLNITVDNIPGSTRNNTSGVNEVEVSLQSANFTHFNAVATILQSLPGYQSMEKSLSSGVGSYSITYKGTADAFLNELNKKLGSKYEVTGFDADQIELKVK